MPQQINLLTPVLMVPKRYFSAQALMQALGLVLIGCVAVASWTQWQMSQARQAFEMESVRAQQERKLLTQALTQQPVPADPKLLAQDLAAAQQQLLQLQEQLAGLEAGRLRPGQAHSDLLQWLAQQTPTGIWLQQVRWQGGTLAMEGVSQQASALNPWLKDLGRHPMLRPLQLGTIHVDAQEGGVWRFSLRSSLPTQALVLPSMDDAAASKPGQEVRP